MASYHRRRRRWRAWLSPPGHRTVRARLHRRLARRRRARRNGSRGHQHKDHSFHSVLRQGTRGSLRERSWRPTSWARAARLLWSFHGLTHLRAGATHRIAAPKLKDFVRFASFWSLRSDRCEDNHCYAQAVGSRQSGSKYAFRCRASSGCSAKRPWQPLSEPGGRPETRRGFSFAPSLIGP